MQIDKNNFHRFEIKGLTDPGFEKKGQKITGINGYSGSLGKILGFLLEKIFGLAVSVKETKGVYYFNKVSLSKYLHRVGIEATISQLNHSDAVKKIIETAISQKSVKGTQMTSESAVQPEKEEQLIKDTVGDIQAAEGASGATPEVKKPPGSGNEAPTTKSLQENISSLLDQEKKELEKEKQDLQTILRIYNSLANNYIKLGQIPDAISAYKKIAKYGSRFGLIQISLLKISQEEKASIQKEYIIEFEAAVKAKIKSEEEKENPDKHLLGVEYESLGLAYLSENRLYAAKYAFEKAIDNGRESAIPRKKETLLKIIEERKARIFEIKKGSFPSYYPNEKSMREDYTYIGECQDQLGQRDKALEAFGEAISLGDNGAFQKVKRFFKEGQIDREKFNEFKKLFEKSFEKLIEEIEKEKGEKKKGELSHELGQYYYDIENLEKALEWERKAEKLGTHFAGAKADKIAVELALKNKKA